MVADPGVPVPVLDAHHHVWSIGRSGLEWIRAAGLEPLRRTFTVDDLYDEAAGCGTVAGVVVQSVTELDETSDLLDLASRDPRVAAVVGWVDLTDPGVADVLARLRTGAGGERLRGVRHQVQGEPDPRWLCRDDVRAGLAAVGRAGLVYELLVRPHQLPAAVETVRALPDVRFVLDHGAKPDIAGGGWRHWRDDLVRLAAADNVACKLSGLVTEADWSRWSPSDLEPYVAVVLEAFGPDRVMFGSDWPVCRLAASYAQVLAVARQLTAGLSGPERSAVFAGTAARLYEVAWETGADVERYGR